VVFGAFFVSTFSCAGRSY